MWASGGGFELVDDLVKFVERGLELFSHFNNILMIIV